MKMDVNYRETKCHICDLKCENLDHHIFTFHTIHGVKTEKIDEKCKLECFVKLNRVKIQSKKILQPKRNNPENETLPSFECNPEFFGDTPFCYTKRLKNFNPECK